MRRTVTQAVPFVKEGISALIAGTYVCAEYARIATRLTDVGAVGVLEVALITARQATGAF